MKFVFNKTVESIQNIDNKVLINNEYIFDYCINCTYNQLNNNQQDCIFEKTISLVYKRIYFLNDFNALTIMDGGFSSIFPKNLENNEYTLTNVTHTPFIKSKQFKEIENYILNETELQNIKNNMENNIKIYLPDFEKEFKYIGYFTSFKCKMNNNNDGRECIITHDKNIISVHCGKIIGIFEFEKYLKKFFSF